MDASRSVICGGEEGSASLITQTRDVQTRVRSNSINASYPLCLAAIGTLLLGGGAGPWSSSLATTQPTPTRSASASTANPGEILAEEAGANEASGLLALVGAWAGDDFEECLQLVYETRSSIVEPDVPA